ncbi:hypothetical protein IMSHALPRED_005175 [Imshaugia aleurites]|uniref:Kinesin light chain n=1 Tax=Imshaugia aleurites TaxID=172621 RepID=A0A8H3FET2_9LECA|nr:hypothetical protein IMSHALPRED_005175 [Imshaugia aleurites]
MTKWLESQKWLGSQDLIDKYRGCAVELLKNCFPKRGPDNAEDWEVCEVLLPHVQALCELSFPHKKQQLQQADVHSYTAQYLKERGRYNEASEFVNRALETQRSLLGENDPATWHTALLAGSIAADNGQYLKVEALFRPALEVGEKSQDQLRQYKGSAVDGLMSYVDNMRSCLASVLISQHRTDEAIAILRPLVVKRERELRNTELGKTDRETLVTMMDLGRAMLHHGDYNEARVLLKEAVARSSASRGDNHIDTARCQKYLALIEQASGRLEEAEKLFRIVKDKFHDLVPAEHPQALLSIIDLAVVIENRKKYGEAERLYRYALDTYKNTLGETDLTTLETTSKLLHVLYLQGKHEM